MADNILKGIIQIEAPGVVQATNQVSSAIGKTEASLKKLTPASNQAAIALNNVSRVAQDAPYGFIGIANNLNPLLESFQRLKAETGSTKSALSALGSSLTGAGGIGLALGVVSSLAVVFGDKLFGASKKSKELREEQDKLAQSISGEIVQLSSLVAIVTNVNAKQTDREKGLKAINQQYGDYLNSLGIEKATLTNISEAYDKIIDGLIRQAVVKGLQEEIEKSVRKTAAAILALKKTAADVQPDLNNLNKEVEGNTQAIEKQATQAELLERALQKTGRATTDGFLAQQRSIQLRQKETASVATYEDRLNRLKDQLKKDLAPLFEKLKDFSFEDLNVSLGKDKPLKVDGPVKLKVRKAEFDFTNLDPTGIKGGKSVGDLEATPKIKLKIGPDVQAALDRLKEKIRLNEGLGEAFSDALFGGFTDGIEAIGQGLGNIISGKDFGGGIVAVMGNLLQTLGKALIKYGAIKAGLDKILGPGGIAIPGGVAIALGAAAIAAGAAFKNLSGARAMGGPVGSGGSYLVGERGPEIFTPNVNGSIIPNSRLGSYGGGSLAGQVQFVISGNNLIGVMSAAGRNQRRLV